MTHPIRALACAGALLAAIAMTACGGRQTMASRSAAALDEATKKGNPVSAGDHGGHSAGHEAPASDVAGTSQATMPGMDHSAMAGMDHAKMTGMQHGSSATSAHDMAGMKHGTSGAPAHDMAGMQHGTSGAAAHDMTGMQHGSSGTNAHDMAGMDHGSSATGAHDMAGMKHGTSGAAAHDMKGMQHDSSATSAHDMAAMDHSSMPGMQHSGSMSGMSGMQHRPATVAPRVIAAPTSNAAIAQTQPAATLESDEFDAPAPVAVEEAAKAATGMSHSMESTPNSPAPPQGDHDVQPPKAPSAHEHHGEGSAS